MLSGHLVRVGSALGSGDRAVNQTDRSPPPSLGAHGLVCVSVHVHCARERVRACESDDSEASASSGTLWASEEGLGCHSAEMGVLGGF